MNAPAKMKESEPAPMQLLRVQLEQRLDSFAEALPSHISPQQFKATLMRAAMGDPDLLIADRVSFFEAALAAAVDGLLPDKREGAMVIYNTKIKDNGREIWIKKVQWMPMIRGIFTKVYNTGKVKSAAVGIVYEGDNFRAWTDDDGEHLLYEEGEEQNRDVIRRVFAQVVMLNGGVFVETMRLDDIEKVRQSSKSSDRGPWGNWWDEMAKKTVFRRLSKRLPISREVAPLFDRDNYLYQDLKDVTPQAEQPKSLAGRLDALVDRSSASTPNHGTASQDAEDTGSSSSAVSDESEGKPEEEKASASSGDPTPVDKARQEGAAARAKGMARKAMPAQYRQDEQLAEAWLAGFDEGGDG